MFMVISCEFTWVSGVVLGLMEAHSPKALVICSFLSSEWRPLEREQGFPLYHCMYKLAPTFTWTGKAFFSLYPPTTPYTIHPIHPFLTHCVFALGSRVEVLSGLGSETEGDYGAQSQCVLLLRTGIEWNLWLFSWWSSYLRLSLISPPCLTPASEFSHESK